jgi:hypothetical protein
MEILGPLLGSLDHISYLKAGIDPELLTLAYEPEAAAIYCKELTVQKKEGAEGSNLQSFEILWFYLS